VLGAVFTLARFSEAFLVLRAQNVGLELGYVPVVMIVMNVFYAAAAYPAGAAADTTTAIHITALMLLLANQIMSATASKGPIKAPTDSSDWRSP
jgi:hypothetical protein